VKSILQPKKSMKKLIYLPLLAIIVLTGCKGNSFMTQRYTQFGHSSNKKGVQEKIVATDSEKSTAIATVNVKYEKPNDVLICSADSKKISEIPVSAFPAFTLKTTQLTITTDDFSENLTSTKSNNKIYKTKKSLRERYSSAKGILDSVLGIVVTIVVLVVVIVLVLILVAAIV